MLAIADDGGGMQDASDGTGLSIVRALVRDELGGTLDLTGDGDGLRAGRAIPGRLRRTTMRILIAEDETIIRLDLRELLEKRRASRSSRRPATARRRSSSRGARRPTSRCST